LLAVSGTIWWLILTITWLLAAGFKWGSEAIEKRWMYFHAVAWTVSSFQTVTVALWNKVEGDNVAGEALCCQMHRSVTCSLMSSEIHFLPHWQMITTLLDRDVALTKKGVGLGTHPKTSLFKTASDLF